MKISHRLYVTIAPAVVGVLTVAALVYYGEFARQAPELVVGVAIAAAAVSAVAAWSNARYLARRIERLAGASPHAGDRPGDSHGTAPPNGGRVAGLERIGRTSDSARAFGPLRGLASAVAPSHVNAPPDEIDEIQRTIDRLSHAVDTAASDRAEMERRLGQRVRDHARLLVAVADDATRRLEDVRLPLHILLESRFGELNENQEELLGAARAAAESIDAELVSLRRIAELDLAARQLNVERVKPSELIESLLPLLVSAAAAAGASLRTEVEPLLPAVHVDRAQFHEAVTTLFRAAIGEAARGSPLELVARRSAGAIGTAPGDARRRIPEAGAIHVELRGAGAPRPTIHTALARRIIEAHGGDIRQEARPEGGEVLAVVLPAADRIG